MNVTLPTVYYIYDVFSGQSGGRVLPGISVRNRSDGHGVPSFSRHQQETDVSPPMEYDYRPYKRWGVVMGVPGGGPGEAGANGGSVVPEIAARADVAALGGAPFTSYVTCKLASNTSVTPQSVWYAYGFDVLYPAAAGQDPPWFPYTASSDPLNAKLPGMGYRERGDSVEPGRYDPGNIGYPYLDRRDGCVSGGGGGGWGAPGGSAIVYEFQSSTANPADTGANFEVTSITVGTPPGLGGNAIQTNGHAVTWLGGQDRAYGAVG